MSTDSETAASQGASTIDSGTLEPFPGLFIPGICFESGHCIWLLEFSSTPTEFDSYTELWLITPDGDRVLYTDPRAAGTEVTKYHEFDRTEGADIVTDNSRSRVDVTMDAADGTTIDVSGTVGQTPGTRILNAVIAVTPARILRSRFGAAVSTLSVNLLTDANGLEVAGATETGRRYRLDAERMARITDASASLDGSDLGELQPPSRPIEFGDATTTGDALSVAGVLHLERFEE